MKVGEQIRIVLEQGDIVDQQIPEITGVQDFQPVLVGFVTLDALAICKLIGLIGGHFVRQQGAVLPAIDQAGQIARGPALGINVRGFDDLFAQADLVIGIDNGEARFEAYQLCMTAQDLRRN